MSASAIFFMLGCWAFVLGLTAWCFARVFRPRRPPEPEGSPSDGVP